MLEWRKYLINNDPDRIHDGESAAISAYGEHPPAGDKPPPYGARKGRRGWRRVSFIMG